MDEYKSNSHKSRERTVVEPLPNKKKVEKVVSGPVDIRKKTKLQRFAEAFVSEDVSSVRSYIWSEVIVPSAKKAISDAISNGVDMMLYGEAGTSRKNSNASRISYQNYYERGNNHRDYSSDRTRTGYNYNEIIFNDRGEAEDVLSRMDELVEAYGNVSVADLYDLVGIAGNYTDNKSGWIDIRTARVVRVRNGYMIELPKAMPLN